MESNYLALFIGYPHCPQDLWIMLSQRSKFCAELRNRYSDLSTDLSTLSTGTPYPQHIIMLIFINNSL